MSRPNFRIIEGDYTYENYEDIKKDYMDVTIPKKDILEKYDLNDNRYYRIIARVKKETGFCRSKGHNYHTNPNHHLRESDNGLWTIVKSINDKYRYWGTYPDRDTAVMVRDKLIEHDWDIDYSIGLIEEYGKKPPKHGTNKYLGNNHYHRRGDAVSDALEKYDEFEKHYFEGKLSVNGILKELDFTHRQYNTCLKHLRSIHGHTHKKLVRDVL